MIPLFHDFAGERVLVFGGGAIGARKARRFATEAEVVAVAPEFVDDDFGGATRLLGEPEPDEVGQWIDRIEPALVVAATDDGAVNAAIESAALERDILVNRADRSGERDAGSVVVPATARDGPVVVAVSTSGEAPILSGSLREDVEVLIEGLGDLADLLADLREDVGEYGVPSRKRRATLQAIVESGDVREALEAGDRERAREAAIEILEDAAE